jgi:hypothetical protein
MEYLQLRGMLGAKGNGDAGVMFWKEILAVAAGVVVRAGRVALGASGSVTASTAIRIGRGSGPSFLPPTPERVPSSVPDAWSGVAPLTVLLKADITSMHSLQQEIAALSLKYMEAAWKGVDSQSVAHDELVVGRREAVATDRRLELLDSLVSKFEQNTGRATRIFARFEQELSRYTVDLAALLLIRRGIRDLMATLRVVRMIDVSFQLLMTRLHGPSAELNASTQRAATLAARTIVAHDGISEACERLVATVDRLVGR